jgi:hypothetical protein
VTGSTVQTARPVPKIDLSHVVERHPQFAQGHGGEFVQDLSADGDPLGEQLFDAVCLAGIPGKQLQQYAGIEKRISVAIFCREKRAASSASSRSRHTMVASNGSCLTRHVRDLHVRVPLSHYNSVFPSRISN